MSKHLKRAPAYVIIGALLIFLVVWVAALIECESLTSKYYSDFEYAYLNNTMLGDVDYLKVLECDGNTARVYYVSDNETMGSVLKFKKQNGTWIETGWDTIWSAQGGSASEAVWPYWHQFFITPFKRG